MNNTQAGWISYYEKKGALWLHDGNSKRPHALLTSGKHSSGFFNSELVMEDPDVLDQACSDLCEIVGKKLNEGEGCELSRVVGPAMGAITLAHNLALQFTSWGWLQVLRAYTEKNVKICVVRGANSIMIDDSELQVGDQIVSFEKSKMVFKRTKIIPGESILLCEDVITTAGSVKLCAQAVTEAGGVVLPFVAALVNRSGLTEVNGMKIIALIDKPMPMWSPDECPLCKQGSEALRPKGKENWARLNDVY
ncbi:MAG: phosphoribosyltransferase family protein [bacterium]